MACVWLDLKLFRVSGDQDEQGVAVLGESYVPRPFFTGFADPHGLIVADWKLDSLGPRSEPEGNGAR